MSEMTTHSRTTLSIFSLCLLVSNGNTWGSFFNWNILPNKAVIEPTDSLVFVGEVLKLQCHVTDKTIQVSPQDMYFEITPHQKNTSRTITLKNVTVVDNETIYSYVKITDDFSSMTTVSCRYENVIGIVDLKSVYIFAERPIRNITNFTAVYHFNKDVDFSWSLGESYFSTDNILVTVDWSANVPPNKQGSSCIKQTKESCTVQYYGQDIVFIRIKVEYTNKTTRPTAEFLEPLFETSATTVVRIVLNDYLKTQPPINLHVVGKNSTCSFLTWEPPLYFTVCSCDPLYQVTATTKDESSGPVIGSGRRNSAQNNISICSLSPDTTYALNVKIRAKEGNPWSEPAFIQVTTDEDCPLTGPPLTDTSYHADECMGNKSDVTVYWNDPSKSSLRGELTRFEVKVDNATVLLRKGSNYYKTSLDCDSDHRVLVYSATAVGTSLTPSDIVIPKRTEELPTVSDVTVKMEPTLEASASDRLANVTVSWHSGPLRGSDATLILYMCQDANAAPNTCFNDFLTREASVDTEEMHLGDLETSISLFGFSLKDHEGHKRGIQWIDCVYRPEQKPNRPSPAVVSVGNTPRTLMISWSTARCDSKTKVLILRYHLFICTREDSQLRDFCSQMTVNSTTTSYKATNLVGGRTYYVYIQAESPAGVGPASKPATGVLVADNSNSGLVIDVVMGTLSAMIFVSLLLVCCIRRCRQSKKRTISLAKDNSKIWNIVDNIESHDSKECDIDTASTLTSSLETPLAPLALSLQGDRDLTPQLSSSTACPVETAHPTKVNSAQDKLPIFVTPGQVTDPHLTGTNEALNSLKLHNVSKEIHVCSDSNSANPYVKITNKCFSSLVNGYCPVSVDEGYNSPEAGFDSPEFLVNAPETNLASVPSLPLVCRDKPLQSRLPLVSPQPQNVFMCSDVSVISSESHTMLSESDLFYISPQSCQMLLGSNLNSSYSQIIPETNAFTASPPSQETLSTTKLPQLSMKSSDESPNMNVALRHVVNKDSSDVHAYTISNDVYPLQALSLQRTFLPTDSLEGNPPVVSSTEGNPPVVDSTEGSPPVVNSAQGTVPVITSPKGNAPAINSANGNAPAVNILEGNSPAVCYANNPPPVSLLNRINNTQHAAYSVSDTCLLQIPQKDVRHENKDSCGTTTQAENSSGISNGCSSYHQMSSGYVTCMQAAPVNLDVKDSDLEQEFLDLEISNCKANCQMTQHLTVVNGNEDTSAGYRSVEFLDNYSVPDLENHNGIVTCDGASSQGELEDGMKDFDHQGRFKEDSVIQTEGLDCVNNDNSGCFIDYVTCTVDGEVNFEDINPQQQLKSVSQQVIFSKCKPNCQGNGSIKSRFSGDKSDKQLSQNDCSGVLRQEPFIEMNQGQENTSTGYKSLDFLENGYKLGVGQLGQLGARQEEFDSEGELKMHQTFVNNGDLTVVNCNGVADGVNDEAASYVRLILDKGARTGEYTLKPSHVENSAEKQIDSLPTHYALENGSIFYFAIPAVDAVSQVTVSAQVESGVCNTDSVLGLDSEGGKEEGWLARVDPGVECCSPNCDVGYVTVSCLPGGSTVIS